MTKIDKVILQPINELMERTEHSITLPVAIQASMSILEKIYPNLGFDALYEKIQFKANPSLSFQKSDIENITFVNTNNTITVEITLNFLSIFGASSPIPSHYKEKILEDSQKDKILYDFLNILNHRIMRLIYPVWAKHRYYIQYRHDLQDRLSKYFLSLIGLYPQSQGIPTSLNINRLMPFIASLGMHQKSSASILPILKHYFNHKEIEIQEGIISKFNISQQQQMHLGDTNSTLGSDMHIGTFILSRALSFIIAFKEVEWEDLENFSYIGCKKREMDDLMKILLNTPLDYQISITISKEKIQPCILGTGSMLGSNSWIGDVHSDQTIMV